MEGHLPELLLSFSGLHRHGVFTSKPSLTFPYRLKEIPCLNCDERGVTLDFRIVMSVRESLYFVTCRTCHHPFVERFVFRSV